MKATIKLVAFAVVLTFLFSCATVDRVSSDDPFSNQLDTLYSKRQNSEHWIFASALTLAASVITGTVFTTLYNLNKVDSRTATAAIITSYSISALATGWGTYQFFNFDKYFNEYLETLRLQTQYNNAIQWTNKQSGQ